MLLIKLHISGIFAMKLHCKAFIQSSSNT